MARPRTCPNCLKATPVQEGCDFDQDGNLLCRKCGRIMYPFTLAAETEVDNSIRSKATANRDSTHSRHVAWNGGGYAATNQNISSAATQVDDDDAG